LSTLLYQAYLGEEEQVLEARDYGAHGSGKKVTVKDFPSLNRIIPHPRSSAMISYLERCKKVQTHN
jgi:hypothetical protein